MPDPRVVVLGAGGMLGHKLFERLRGAVPGTLGTLRRPAAQSGLGEVTLLHGPDVVSGVDANDFDALRARLRGWRPEVIVNCIGVIKQRDAAACAIPSITINALFPHRLAELAGEWGGRVIHFSTDCVFSGHTGSYTEGDPSDAADLYGKSKFLGEVGAPNALTLRTSIIGRELSEHRSLLDWFLAKNGSRVQGYQRAIYSGITTNEMATVVARVIADCRDLSGVYQVASAPISKHDLLVLIRDAYGLDIAIDPVAGEVCDRSMVGTRFETATGWRAPSWPAMIGQLAADRTPYPAWGIHRFDAQQLELRNV